MFSWKRWLSLSSNSNAVMTLIRAYPDIRSCRVFPHLLRFTYDHDDHKIALQPVTSARPRADPASGWR